MASKSGAKLGAIFGDDDYLPLEKMSVTLEKKGGSSGGVGGFEEDSFTLCFWVYLLKRNKAGGGGGGVLIRQVSRYSNFLVIFVEFIVHFIIFFVLSIAIFSWIQMVMMMMMMPGGWTFLPKWKNLKQGRIYDLNVADHSSVLMIFTHFSMWKLGDLIGVSDSFLLLGFVLAFCCRDDWMTCREELRFLALIVIGN